LVDVYENWDEANRANAFCQNETSCYDTVAECFNDTNHPESKFCRCPTGYRIDTSSNRRQCGRNQQTMFFFSFSFSFFRIEAIKSQYLSPIENDVSNYGVCGACSDEHAVCINVAGKQTCWCQAGYVKNGDKCRKD
jgi:hypothetical protein